MTHLATKGNFSPHVPRNELLRRVLPLGWAAALTCALFLCGCGGSLTTGTLVASSTNLAFGDVAVGQTASATVILQNQSGDFVRISQLSVSGQYFSSSVGQSSLPLTIAANSSYSLSVQFNPGAAGSMAGQLTVTSDASNGSSMALSVSGKGVPAPSALNCASGAITAAGTDSCTVTLNAAAASGGQTVELTSNSAAVTVPSTVTVPEGQTSASFTATIATVSVAQNVAVTANVAGISQSYALQVGAAAPILSGTGGASLYSVNLTWDAPIDSPDPVAGYVVYRTPSGGNSYQLLNTEVVTTTAYTDTTVQSGQTYDYIVESVDASGVTSVASNTAVMTVP